MTPTNVPMFLNIPALL
jgi:hypothetical protein